MTIALTPLADGPVADGPVADGPVTDGPVTDGPAGRLASPPSPAAPGPDIAGAHEDPGFGVYVHWPFCQSKCPYCDFNSHVRHRPVDQARFARALAREIATTAARVPDETVSTIFFGGGTPSLMAPSTVAAVLEAIAAHWPVAADVEVTLEANPASVEAARFAGYRDAGVTRLSLGVQALRDAALTALGRRHDVAQAKAAIEIARRTFETFSCDLIYARPGQGLSDWAAELAEAIDLGTPHLSLYQLTIEPGTPFAALYRQGKLVVPDDGLAADLYELTAETTVRHGLPPYEISNHARPGHASRHNLVYWRGGRYAGIGPGAHGRLKVDGVRRATVAERHPERWLAQVEDRGDGLVADEALAPREVADEFLVMGLRLVEGISRDRYERLSGGPLEPARIADLAEAGLLEIDGDRLRATAAGRLVLNRLVAELSAAVAGS